jgi:hypothetical protein
LEIDDHLWSRRRFNWGYRTTLVREQDAGLGGLKTGAANKYGDAFEIAIVFERLELTKDITKYYTHRISSVNLLFDFHGRPVWWHQGV